MPQMIWRQICFWLIKFDKLLVATFAIIKGDIFRIVNLKKKTTKHLKQSVTSKLLICNVLISVVISDY